VENFIWKRLWACRTTYYGKIVVIMLMMSVAFVVQVIRSKWRRSVIQPDVTYLLHEAKSFLRS
jgi:hypothetical protein